MTSINIELKRRKEVVEIAQILSIREDGPADYPEMVVKDTNGKQHILSFLDFSISLHEWKKIRPGSKIEIIIEESIIGKKFL